MKAVSGIMLTLLFIGMLTLAFNIQPVRASGTIYITADGSVNPPTAPIQRDGDVYTFTGNIYESIVALRDNIVIDGAGYTVQGTGIGLYTGLKLFVTSNVTVKNTKVTGWWRGIYLDWSCGNTLKNNIVSNNTGGIDLLYSSGNTFTGNTALNNHNGIFLHHYSNNNILTGNTFSNNSDNGIWLFTPSGNILSGNSMINNGCGIRLWMSSNNTIFHNNLVDNTGQVYSVLSTNLWDDGYPSGGNFWSDHVTVDDYSGINQDELGSDGIVDEPYIIDDDNRDRYPLVNPWTPVITANINIDPDTLNLKSKGEWITAYIELPEDYDVEDIDISTVLLDDAIPAVTDTKYGFVTNSSAYITDHDGDGVLECMVKFNRTAVAEYITDVLGIEYGNVTLTITGEVAGISFEGEDIIKVLFPGDVDDDGDVDPDDLYLFAGAYGTSLGDAAYNWAADFNEDGRIDPDDLHILAGYYGRTAV